MVEEIFGSGKDLAAHQVAARACILFFITMVLIRIAGMRSFGRKSPFDSIVVIMLGAVLSRPVVGASAFWPTVAGATVLVVIHRILSVLTARFPTIERLVKGSPRVLVHEGRHDERAMWLAGISCGDLDEAARKRGLVRDHRGIDTIYLEASGEVTLVEEKSR